MCTWAFRKKYKSSGRATTKCQATCGTARWRVLISRKWTWLSTTSMKQSPSALRRNKFLILPSNRPPYPTNGPRPSLSSSTGTRSSFCTQSSRWFRSSISLNPQHAPRPRIHSPAQGDTSRRARWASSKGKPSRPCLSLRSRFRSRSGT